MKIIVVAPYLKTIGGATRHIWELCEHLVKKGDSIILASLFSDKNLYSSNSMLRLVDLADETYLPQTIKYWFNLRKIRKNLRSLIKTEDPNVVIFIN